MPNAKDPGRDGCLSLRTAWSVPFLRFHPRNRPKQFASEPMRPQLKSRAFYHELARAQKNPTLDERRAQKANNNPTVEAAVAESIAPNTATPPKRSKEDSHAQPRSARSIVPPSPFL